MGPSSSGKKRSAPEYHRWRLRGGRLYTMGNNGSMDVVFCLDAATGAEIWRHTYPQSLDAASI